jgi:hypothetical protein
MAGKTNKKRIMALFKLKKRAETTRPNRNWRVKPWSGPQKWAVQLRRLSWLKSRVWRLSCNAP